MRGVRAQMSDYNTDWGTRNDDNTWNTPGSDWSSQNAGFNGNNSQGTQSTQGAQGWNNTTDNNGWASSGQSDVNNGWNTQNQSNNTNWATNSKERHNVLADVICTLLAYGGGIISYIISLIIYMVSKSGDNNTDVMKASVNQGLAISIIFDLTVFVLRSKELAGLWLISGFISGFNTVIVIAAVVMALQSKPFYIPGVRRIEIFK